MNKGGFLRILEAIIAVILIMSVMFLLFNKTRTSNEPDLSEKARNILEEVASNFTMREAVLNNNKSIVDNYISTKIPESYLKFETRICEVDEACGKPEYVGNLYSAERIISSTIETLGPKKIRLFIWRIS